MSRQKCLSRVLQALWEKKGDLLILKGNNVGSRKHEFVDTMKIDKMSKTELTLSQAGNSVTYLKK